MQYSFFEFYELVQQNQISEGLTGQHQHSDPMHVNAGSDGHQGRGTAVMQVDPKSIEAGKLLAQKKRQEFKDKHPWIFKATNSLDKERRADQAGEKALGMGNRVRQGSRIVGTTAPAAGGLAMGPRQQPPGIQDIEDQIAKTGGAGKTVRQVLDMRDNLFAIQGMLAKRPGFTDDSAWMHPEVVKKAKELAAATKALGSSTLGGAEGEEIKALNDALKTLFDHLRSAGA